MISNGTKLVEKIQIQFEETKQKIKYLQDQQPQLMEKFEKICGLSVL